MSSKLNQTQKEKHFFIYEFRFKYKDQEGRDERRVQKRKGTTQGDW